MTLHKQEGSSHSVGCSPLSGPETQYILSVRDAGIGANATTGRAKEPWEIGRAVLRITSKIVDGSSANVIAEGDVATGPPPRLGEERIEDRSWRWNCAARPIRIAGRLRGQYVRLELEGGIPRIIIIRSPRCAQRAESIVGDRTDLQRGGRVLGAVRPVRQVGCPVEVHVRTDTIMALEI
jgi:hypothetical protein